MNFNRCHYGLTLLLLLFRLVRFVPDPAWRSCAAPDQGSQLDRKAEPRPAPDLRELQRGERGC